jgi:hypothetical protein
MTEIQDALIALDIERLRKEVTNNINFGTVTGCPIFRDYADEHDVDHPDDFDFQTHPELKEGFAAYVDKRVATSLKQVSASLSSLTLVDGKVPIWRGIRALPTWFDDEITSRPLGICWAYDKAFAYPHEGAWTQGLIDIRLEALANIEDVDWYNTLYHNIASEHLLGEEKEIRLNEDAAVDFLSAQQIKEKDGMEKRFEPGTLFLHAHEAGQYIAPGL